MVILRNIAFVGNFEHDVAISPAQQPLGSIHNTSAYGRFVLETLILTEVVAADDRRHAELAGAGSMYGAKRTNGWRDPPDASQNPVSVDFEKLGGILLRGSVILGEAGQPRARSNFVQEIKEILIIPGDHMWSPASLEVRTLPKWHAKR